VQHARSIIIQRILKDYQKCVQAIRSLAKAHQEMDDEYIRNLVSSKEELEQQIRQAREAKQVLQEKQEQAARLSAELERHLASGKRGIR
jgi:DNA-binding NarL/FixJ family response regulator